MAFWKRMGTIALAMFAALNVSDAIAQTIPLMGYVAAKNANPKRLEVFKQGLTELGYVEGKSIRIEYREAVLDAEYHGVVADLISRNVNIILAANVAAAVAAAKATKPFRSCCLRSMIRSGLDWLKAWSDQGRTSPERRCTLLN